MRLSETNPMRSTLLTILVFELIVVWLGYLGMAAVGVAHQRWALIAIIVISAVLVGAMVGLRQGWGYYLGWLAQAAFMATGIFSLWMLAMGAIFALIWVMAFVMGRRLESQGKEV